MRTLYIGFPKRLEKEEIKLVRVPCKKRQRAIRFSWRKEDKP